MTQMVEAADDTDAFWILPGATGVEFTFGRNATDGLATGATLFG